MQNKNIYKIRIFVALVVFVMASLGTTGIFYKLRVFDVQILPLIHSHIVDFTIVGTGLLAILSVLTFIFGRIYCSTLCPFGLLQELLGEFLHKKNSAQKNLPVKYFILAIVLGSLVGGTTLLLRVVEPYTLFSNIFTGSIMGIVSVIAVVGLIIWKNRVFCTNICPVGTILGIFSKFSVFKIRLNQDMCVSCGACERICPAGSINSKEKIIDNETCIKCLKCTSACPRGGVTYSKEKPVKFNLSRRNVLTSASAILLFGVFAKIGNELKIKISEKFKNIILPAGASNQARMLNTCTNCNLCVKNCPKKILKPADEEFGAVHIDYSESFCKYDCNECSKNCPVGAIKDLTLKEKQSTQIAVAKIDTEICSKCMACVKACPKGAISFKKGVVKIDETKCIGCGLCKNICTSNAILMIAVKEQRMV